MSILIIPIVSIIYLICGMIGAAYLNAFLRQQSPLTAELWEKEDREIAYTFAIGGIFFLIIVFIKGWNKYGMKF